MKAGVNLKIVALDSTNIFDRIKLCWGHLENWRELKPSKSSKEWLERSNAVFKPTTFIAYVDDVPVGMIEFLPQRLLKRLKLCSCRLDAEHGETEDRYDLGEGFENYLFISCLSVSKDYQGKNIGKALLNYFLSSNVSLQSDGAVVYVTERNQNWESYIHWPAGPKEFYIKRGFVIRKQLNDPLGYLLSYTNAERAKPVK